jgi:hypothetical protein
MCQTKVEKEIRKHTFMFNKFCLENRTVYDNVEKESGARQDTDDNIIWCMRFACWITTATETHL